MTRCWLLCFALLACAEPAVERDAANARRTLQELSATLKIKVSGGALLDVEPPDGLTPGRALIRAQSLDLRVELEDDGCEPQALILEVENLPGGALTRRLFIEDLSAEARAARDALGGVGTLSGDPHDPEWTPLESERAVPVEARAGGFALTLTTDRGRAQVATVPGAQETPLPAPTGACLRLADTQDPLGSAPMVLRLRARLPASAAAFSFGFMGNTATRTGTRDRILAHMASAPLRFAVLGGDITEAGDLEELTALKAVLGTFPFPVFATVGERETRGEVNEAFLDTLGTTTFAFDAGVLRVLVLDSADATLSTDTHNSLETWLTGGPLAFAGEPIPPASLVITHVPPFDPAGLRGMGFKHRPEAARVMAELYRASALGLLTAHHDEYSLDSLAGVPIVHLGAPTASAPYWIKADVAATCQAAGLDGAAPGEPCATTADCESGLTCAADLRCAACVTFQRIDVP